MKKWLIPVIALVGVLAAITLAVTPMLKAAPKDIPMAVLSLDQTVNVQGQDLNYGQTVLTNLTTSAGGLTLPIKWTTCDTQSCVDDALANHSVYAALVIPADFTSSNVASQSGTSTDSPSQIGLTIDEGLNPGMSATVEAMMSQVSSTSGLTFATTYINQVPADQGSGAIATMLAVLIMFASMITTIVLVNVIKVDFTKKAGRVRTILQQVGGAAGLALITAIVAPLILGGLAGAKLPYGDLVGFAAIGFFAFSTIVLFSVDWLGLRGLVIPALILVLGIPILALPYEAMIGFWQYAVYPWVPQRFMIEGTRGILFMGQSVGNRSSLLLAVTAIVGLVLLFASLARPVTKAAAVQTEKVDKSATAARASAKRRHR
ncbi:MAG: hypothetical protein FWF36_07360 [Propionibacteriaceae bacterium]|nr:hypothetical protein [Propionibacteriaceae bacterium]